ncbi:MAG: ribonuclease HII [Thermoplasmata archaeon]|nr:MAG: ribonuclease HII [Thermoplasmata archaeon]RLF35286.1 MAG: ribonuclease HII [Thermoplasmata archaeon]RLF53194.1 MAG: ribonuclease HII [Thermoplasmata archaeon]
MISGVDEAGRGPVVGPLVIAGVTLKDDSELTKNRIRDSKKLSPKRREFLGKKIKKIAVNYEVLVIPAQDIDDMRRVMTLNEIEVNAFAKVIQKLKPEICYVDSADVNEKRFGKNILDRLSFKPYIISKHKADEIYPIVSAASILAKTRRDEEIHKIESMLRKKLDIPLGSGYPADPVTRKFLETWVERFKDLPPHTRCSWETAQNILLKDRVKKLDDF